jgi:hypothetical protein
MIVQRCMACQVVPDAAGMPVQDIELRYKGMPPDRLVMQLLAVVTDIGR